MNTNIKEIGVRIVKARKSLGMSQAELADKLGISVSHMSDIELGKTNYGIDILIRLLEALQISANKLLQPDTADAKSNYVSEISYLIADCSKKDMEIIYKTICALISALEGKKR